LRSLSPCRFSDRLLAPLLAAALSAGPGIFGCSPAGSEAGRGPSRAPDVPYVPTPEDVVTEMLRLAAVTTQDIVYDLGSGDARIVIAAARDFGPRGVGLEIDPLLVEESRKNASVAGVGHLVEFVHADLFRTDIRRATVVAFYLLPSVAEALRPKLLRELAPGTRIVSHNYGMGDWEPREAVRVDERHVVHLWVVPERKVVGRRS